VKNLPKAFIGLMIFSLASVAIALSAPITLELSGGSVIKGDLVSWNGQQAVVKAEFGSMTFRRDQLSQATIQRLELLSGDPQKPSGAYLRFRGDSRKPAKGQGCAQATTPNRCDCAVPTACGYKQRGGTPRNLLHIERLSANWPVLHNQFHRQAA
jgi:hypothetical protein